MKKNTETKPESFFSSKAVIVEGREDRDFILNFLRKLEIDDQIYVHEIGGNNLRDESEKSLKLAASSSEFKQNVRHLAIIFDGDGKESKTLQRAHNGNDSVERPNIFGYLRGLNKKRKIRVRSGRIYLLRADILKSGVHGCTKNGNFRHMRGSPGRRKRLPTPRRPRRARPWS